MMNRKVLFLMLLIGFAVLNMAVIRKNEDPIRDTQTDPILYKQKMEEEKDGKKGPLAYSVKNNPADTFFVEPPFAPKDEGSKKADSRKAVSAGMDWWEEPVAVDTPADAPETKASANHAQEGDLPEKDLFKKADLGVPREGSAEEMPSETEPAASGEFSEKDVRESSSNAASNSTDSWW